MSDKSEATRLADALEAVWPHDEGRATREAAAALLRRWPDVEITPIDAIYAAWHGAGVDIAGGDWRRFVGMLPPTLSAPPAERIAALEETARLYEELRKATDGGSESMTHADAVQAVRDQDDRIAALEQARAALERIYFFQQDIGHPPLASAAEQMREMARSALRKIEEVRRG